MAPRTLIPERRSTVWPAALCLLQLGLCLSVYGVAHSPPGHRGTSTLVLYGALFAVMLGVLAWGCGRDPALKARVARWVVGVGIAGRLALLGVPSYTSHDPDRYLWDGRVAFEGGDPYRLTPDHPEVAHLHGAWASPVEHRRFPTLYPPLSLALFTACAALGPGASFWALKALITAAGIILVWVLGRHLRSRGDPLSVAWVAWHPLAILEAGVGAHVDTLVALFVVGVVLTPSARRGGALLALGVLTKLTPAVALWPLWCRRGSGVLTGAGATLAVGYGLALAVGWRPWGSTGEFFRSWRNGAPLFSALEVLLGVQTLPVAALVGAALLGWVGLLVRRGRIASEVDGLALSLGALFLLSPVVFPWYLLPLVALLPLQARPWMVLWTATAPLTYEVLDRFDVDGTWVPASWPLWVIGAAWLLGLAAWRAGRPRVHKPSAR